MYQRKIINYNLFINLKDASSNTYLHLLVKEVRNIIKYIKKLKNIILLHSMMSLSKAARTFKILSNFSPLLHAELKIFGMFTEFFMEAYS